MKAESRLPTAAVPGRRVRQAARIGPAQHRPHHPQPLAHHEGGGQAQQLHAGELRRRSAAQARAARAAAAAGGVVLGRPGRRPCARGGAPVAVLPAVPCHGVRAGPAGPDR
eukprot:366130-Chlamydomonas_euryale.AAC.45